jgi:hypothetical protein
MKSREFDVGEFARTARGSLRDELDLTSLGATRLDPDVVTALEALRELEGATMAHLRNVLVTPTHKDARVTAFLVTWAFEKFWISDALGVIIALSAGEAPSSRLTDAPAPSRGIRRARGPVRRAFAGFTQGESIVGAHTTLGLVDDWVLYEVYERVSSNASDGSALADALATIIAVKERHTAFFEAESHRRLEASPRAARLARRELRRSPWPLAAAVIDPPRRRAVARFTWSGQAGTERLESLERRIAALPGIGTSAASTVRASLARDASD